MSLEATKNNIEDDAKIGTTKEMGSNVTRMVFEGALLNCKATSQS